MTNQVKRNPRMGITIILIYLAGLAFTLDSCATKVFAAGTAQPQVSTFIRGTDELNVSVLDGAIEVSVFFRTGETVATARVGPNFAHYRVVVPGISCSQIAAVTLISDGRTLTVSNPPCQVVEKIEESSLGSARAAQVFV
jgi:hypothetical protein